MKDPVSGKHIYMIDASLLGISDCLKKVDYIHNEGLTTPDAQFKMDYGNGFHKFAGAIDSGVEYIQALQTALQFFLPKCIYVPEEDFRTVDHLNMVCQTYYKYWYKEGRDIYKTKVINGKPAVELAFCFPYRTTPTYDVLLTGTIDKIATFDGRDFVMDRKVTALWRKQNFFDGFELDPQLKFYSWVCKRYGLSEYYMPGIIDGVFIKKPTEKTKNKITGKLELNKEWNGVSFERSAPMEYSEESMIEFEEWVVDKIDTIIKAEETKTFRRNFNCCSDVYGMCQFSGLCLGRKPIEMYERRDYNPLKFQA
jgi:hypothetical protein